MALGTQDFRFYLDLNRNRRFEPTGLLQVTNQFGRGIPGLSNYFVGDPQWIGGLEFPDQNHSADNPFIYRYAYMIVPSSETMDINYIYNYAKRASPVMGLGSDSFLRNQGVGTWEINLAGLLVDLNTNLWDAGATPLSPVSPIYYNYYSGPGTYTLANSGIAFDDALSVLRYRYAGRWGSLGSASAMYGAPGANAFGSDYIDDYSSGPPMTNTWWPGPGFLDADRLRVTQGWSGAFNTNHFFSMQEIFDPTKTGNLAYRLQGIGITNHNSYDEYTFYRLLSAVGTESSPQAAGKINVNYDNVVATNALGLATSTNFIAWDPTAFFTNTAIKLLLNAGFTVATNHASLTNLLVADNAGHVDFQIPVWPVNYYTPSVHRLLQLTANIFDATTNRAFTATAPFCPTMFRPIFRRRFLTVSGIATNWVFIVGYREVRGTALAYSTTAPPIIEVDNNDRNIALIPTLGTPFLPIGPEKSEPLVSGIPVVVGAKKGFPNFNEFAMQTAMYVTRLLEFRRNPGDTQGPVTHTNEMYVAAITNAFGLEAWNSYSNYYPRNLQMIITANMTALMTNEFGLPLLSNRVNATGVVTNLNMNTWRGWTSASDVGSSFVLPWGANSQFMFLTNSTYHLLSTNNDSGFFGPQTHIFTQNQPFYVPHWYLNINTRLLFVLVDTAANRVVDYVNLNNWEPPIDIMDTLAAGADCSGNPGSLTTPASQWCTNFNSQGVPIGVINQIGLGLGANGTTLPNINSFSMDPYSGLDAQSAVDGFRNNLMGWSPLFPKDQTMTFYKSNVFYVPFDPYTPVYLHTSWQANDPLVHYTIGDLIDLTTTNRVDLLSHNPPLDNLGYINGRYQPWGNQSPGGSSNPSISPMDPAVKDPLITRSDNWDFPTNKFPNIGWLGRVHRGTPWQTIYLKSPNVLLERGVGANQVNQCFQNWQQWTGNQFQNLNLGQLSTSIVPLYNPANPVVQGALQVGQYNDAVFSLPTNDWRIIDLFTTALNDNATRGRLSVNNTNLAAWSAILSGVNVMPDLITPSGPISPAGVYNPAAPPPLVRLVNGIINARTNFPNQCYQRLGDILAAPELTVNSPYINTNNVAFLNDDVYERIPQQILGLLDGGQQPRFVIYSYGQALKPAVHSIVTGGQYSGLCTNYQITAEVATRSVVRLDGAQPMPGQPYHPKAVIEKFNVLPPD